MRQRHFPDLFKQAVKAALTGVKIKLNQPVAAVENVHNLCLQQTVSEDKPVLGFCLFRRAGQDLPAVSTFRV